ncbi:MAG: gliding motility-associated C-terminal domain-containing protein [Saprospiraceae bacterium]
MKPILTQFFAGLFLLLASQAFGQAISTSFVVTQPAAPPYPIGTHIVVEFRVTNFTNIESMQFPITYNNAVMRFDSLSNAVFANWVYPPSLAANHQSLSAQSRIGISWSADLGNNPSGMTLSNGATVFKLHFTTLANGVSPVNISGTQGSNPPIPLEIARQGQGPITVNYQGGGADITIGTGNPPPPPLVGFKIVANNIYIPQGERGCMPLTVNDFDQIIAMQFLLHWNNAVLNFECSRNFNIPSWSASDFALYAPNPGTLVVKWDDPTLAGVTRPDGGRIADVCFKAIGAPGSQTTVTIDGVGGPPTFGNAEAYNANSVNVWTLSGPNGASGVSAPINIIVTPPAPTYVTYTIDTVAAAQTTSKCVAVKVKNFTAITNSEFALAYNPAQLTYSSVQFGPNPLGLIPSNITVPTFPPLPTPPPALNYVKFLWSNTNGVTVTNDSTIFSACFTVIAPSGTTSNINVTTTACPGITGIGTAKAAGGAPMTWNNGWVKSITNGPTPNVTNVNCNGGSTGSISLDNGTGPTPTGYSWAGPNNFSSNLQNITGLKVGTYTVTVTYSGGNTLTVTATVSQPPALSATHTVNTVSCFGGSNGAINLTPAGGTPGYTYLWLGGATTEDRTGLTVDVYTVTITDSKGCTFTVANIPVSGFTEIKQANNSPVVTNVTCAGLSTGGIAITTTGGAGANTYLWSNGSTAKDLANAPAGNYSVTVTDMNGCTKVFSGASFTIGSPPPLAALFDAKTNVKCMNTPTGSASISVSGGTPGMSYCWSTGPGPCASNIEDPTNLSAGTYTAIVTDLNGCTATVANVVISNPANALSVTGSTTPSPCFEQAAGAICTTPAGGWGNYTYAWAGPVVVPAIACPSGIPGGLYTVTVTDAGQCTITQNFTVTGAPAIAANTMVQSVTCFGTNNGGIDLNLSGGNPPYTVVWSNTTLTGETIGNLAPGSYQPTVTDAQSCTKVFAAVVVTGPQLLVIDTSIIAANPNNGTIDLEILSGGTPIFSYLWSNGATTQDISGLVAGTYTVVVKDSNACERTFSFTVPSGNVLGQPFVTATKNSCDHDGCFWLEIAPTATNFTPFTINWGFGTLQTNSLTPQICDLGAGLYNVTITASNGNSSVIPGIQIGQDDPASVNSNTTNPFDELHNGKITLNPAPGVLGQLTYQWGPPLNTTGNQVTNLDSGLYIVTITNQLSGCTTVIEFPLNREYAPFVFVALQGSVTQPTCSSATTGAIQITLQGGNAPYIYHWTGPNGFDETTEDIIDLGPGFYSLTVTDENGTVLDSSWTLTAQSNLNITNVNETSLYLSGHQVSGFNMCDGEAAVVFIPGVGINNILWSNGVTGPNNSTLCGGAYSVTITDNAGCTSVWSDALTFPPAITSTSEFVGATCFGDCNGSAKIIVAGGFAPYKVIWSTGQTDQAVFPNGFSQAVNLCGGVYSVTITDKNMVETVTQVNVPEPQEIVATFAPTTPRNFNACDGSLLIDLTGAVDPVTYVWSGNFGHTGNGERADNLCSGEFVEFYITDANGCTAYATDSVPYPEDGCFRLSPVITPGQQDGKNDNVYITCIETTLENHVEIYNRWGQLVFQTDNYTNEDSDREHNWNGLTNSGVALAEGVYYYVLTYTFVDDQGQQHEGVRKGAINLLH